MAGSTVNKLGIANVRFWATNVKVAGRVRYVGITNNFPNQYAQLIPVMRNETLDFIGVDYAADNRDVEQVILPLSIEKKIAVLAYAPYANEFNAST